jgi:MerR family transcriptional regulator, copper efflux regulator
MDELVPIDEVARRFGIQASALRYYERRGLLAATARSGGRRCYGPEQIRRLAIIGFWQRSGQLSLDDIGELLAGPEPGRDWKQIVRERRDALDEQIRQMTAARDCLDHQLTCPREHTRDGCPYFEKAIWQNQAECHAQPGRTSPA